jgi:hypothetical protein
MAVDTSRLRFGDLIAAGGAVVLFISMFLDWYKVEFKGLGGTGIGATSAGGSAWDTLGIGKIILLLVVLGVIAIVVVRATGTAVPQLPAPLSTIILGLGGLAVLYTLFRLIVIPHGDVPSGLDDAIDFGRGIGVFLAFLSALAITAGGFLSARERGEAVPGVDGNLSGGGGPLGGGQPVGGQPAGGPAYGGQPAVSPPATTAGAGAAPAAAAAAAAGGPKADWYPDPQGQARLRYWDGTQWTDQTAD